MEKLTDIELRDIDVTESRPRQIGGEHHVVYQENDIETALGTIHVAVHGDVTKPAILTYHDIGLNHLTNFQNFFNYSEMRPILKSFCLYHVNAPGQQEGAATLAQGFIVGEDSEGLLENPSNDTTDEIKEGYSIDLSKNSGSLHFPNMDQLAAQLLPVLQFYNLKRIMGFGMGAGANILSRFALQHPERVDALFLINCTASAPGWTEWGYQKVNAWYLRSGHMTAFTEDYLLWHWFGSTTKNRNQDLMKVYKDYIKQINPTNLAAFIEAYMRRTDLGIQRDLTHKHSEVKQFKCNVMLITGDYSGHLDDMVNMNGRLDPTNSTWMKLADCGGMILEENPEKVCEAFRLFLQGMGYGYLAVPTLSQTAIVASKSQASRTQFMTQEQRFTPQMA
ncbi:unnamed protein product [Owenia fusiformis]|uniref:Uncharacterized protein n=1 Tax=Owenia fusiformis TaxID=6347 RepID=A0A8J1USK6_OWEFU|nr:unnamed protein product [Owenia fusiformis]